MGAEAGVAAEFEPLRPRLLRLAYRMLGEMADAEDVVQDAFLRWRQVDPSQVGQAEAYLRQVVTRLCLDQLKSARRRRETYIGPWLPEPVLAADNDEIEDVTLPLMLALERLSALERAAFLLHDVFGVGFEEVGSIIGRDPAACRQLASRARTHVRAARPRHDLPREEGLKIAQAFYTASRQGDMAGLRSLLAAGVAMRSDGGGKKPAGLKPLIGLERVMRLHSGLALRFVDHPSRLLRYGLINGLPGFVTLEFDDTLQTTALQIEGGQVTAIYVVRNPDKLTRIPKA